MTFRLPLPGGRWLVLHVTSGYCGTVTGFNRGRNWRQLVFPLFGRRHAAMIAWWGI